MDLKATRYDVADRLAVITLARPHRHNAWTGRMHTEYRWCLARAETDPGVRAVIVTGDPAGDAFCVGADADALDGHVAAGRYDPGVGDDLARPGYGVRPEWDHAFAYHFGLRVPVLAAVNGSAAGVGLVLACYCDIRFAADDARFSTAHGRLNLPAEYGLSWLLPRLIGGSRALELLLSSRRFDAVEALRIGLVHEVCPAGDVLERTRAYAADLIDQVSRGSLLATRRQVHADWLRDVGSSVVEAEGLLESMVTEPDFERGVRALRARTSPDFP